jgi:ribosomal protein L23
MMAEEKKKEKKNVVEKKEVKKTKNVLGRIRSITKKEEKKKADLSEMEKKLGDKDPLSILKLVLMTEKSVRSVETQNKLVFIVDRKANKLDVKHAVESAFQADVDSVNIMIDQKGRKKAFVKFVKPGIAGEVAIKLGII